MAQANDITPYGLRSRLYREKNPGYDKNWRLKNLERLRRRSAEKQAELRSLYPQKYKAELREWRSKNKDKIRAYMRRWREGHRVELTLAQQARHTKTKVKIDKEDICNWYTRVCGICGLLITDKFHIDHKIPLAKGDFMQLKIYSLLIRHATCARRINLLYNI